MNLNSTETKQIRIFGLIAFIFFGALSTTGILLDKPFPFYFFGALSIIGIGFILMPKQFKPIYKGWLKVAHFIGTVFTTIILTLAYYFVITPFGLVKRLIGGPILPVKPDKNTSSYWVTRAEPSQAQERFIKRY